jgi:hypothetical protein
MITSRQMITAMLIGSGIDKQSKLVDPQERGVAIVAGIPWRRVVQLAVVTASSAYRSVGLRCSRTLQIAIASSDALVVGSSRAADSGG